MMIISLNNDKKSVDDNISVEQLLLVCGFDKDKIAVAVNAEFVARSEYATFTIKADDKVDVLAPVQGG